MKVRSDGANMIPDLVWIRWLAASSYALALHTVAFLATAWGSLSPGFYTDQASYERGVISLSQFVWVGPQTSPATLARLLSKTGAKSASKSGPFHRKVPSSLVVASITAQRQSVTRAALSAHPHRTARQQKHTPRRFGQQTTWLKITAPPLTYPMAAIRRREQGHIVLQAQVDRKGQVRRLRLLRSSGSPRLDQAAIDWGQQLQFKPPVPDRPLVQKIEFKLKSPE